ncbi:hypothetical protein TNCT_42051 [Trichonephila clavata]|uniref:Uncharacterized protein n=2 Tax=Trichonephila clavata TaxID=2740835 RepID=A0A8X6LJV5_TRICU|nr:hypothetical protein TNCT_42051 [Trichonephila clavata]
MKVYIFSIFPHNYFVEVFIAALDQRNGRLRVSQNGDFEPPADPQIEALVLHLELKNEDSTPSIEGRPRCPADFVK